MPRRTTLPQLLTLAAVLGAGACKTGTDQGPYEPNLSAMTVTVDGVDYAGTKAAFGFGSQVAKSSKDVIPISVTFLTEHGGTDFNLATSDFALRVASDGTGTPLDGVNGLNWTPTGQYSGLLSGLDVGQQVQVYFSLYHNSQSHTDFGPYFLPVQRTASTGGGGGPPPPF